MTLDEGKEKFIHAWGKLGSDWGISRTMAQIHALLLIAPEPLSADEIMEALQISRGNANMNIRALIDWGLVHKSLKTGHRKEFFIAEKDMWKVVKNIIVQRKRRELEPILHVLDELSAVQGEDKESKEFSEVIKDIKLFSYKTDAMLENLTKTESDWLVNTFLNINK